MNIRHKKRERNDIRAKKEKYYSYICHGFMEIGKMYLEIVDAV